MLGGEYRHGLDPKNRIFIPAKMRERLGDTFVIAKDMRATCLKVYSLEGWEKYLEPLDKVDKKIADMAWRFLNASMLEATPDSQGRVVLPLELISHAQIEKDAVIVGCGKYAEIWSQSVYDRMKDEIDPAALLAALEPFGF